MTMGLEKVPSQNYSLYAVGLKRPFFRGDYDVVFTGGTPVVLFNTFQNIKRAFVVTSWQDERDGKPIILPDVEGKLCLIASFKE